jgi:flagellar protein FlbD
MIAVTRLDGETVYVNERNIQWVESLPDTAVTFLGGARLLIRESVADLMDRIDGRAGGVAASDSERLPRGATGERLIDTSIERD